MAKKSIFRIMEEMNAGDIQNNTRNIGVSGEVVAADKVKGGAIVKMAAPGEVVMDLMDGKTMLLLIIINKEEYNKVKLASE